MRYEITMDSLILYADPVDIETMRELEQQPGFHSDDTLHEILDDYVARWGMEWIRPEDIEALTSAPLLGLGLQVWGFMDYAIESVQGRLLETGLASWVEG